MKVLSGRALMVLLLCASAMAETLASPVPDGRVARAQFTTAIHEREPVDEVLVLRAPARQVYFFSDLRNLQGRTVTHRWQYGGRTVSEKTFEVGGPRWRVFSSKSLQAGQYGEWSVTVLDQSGWPLYSGIFRYQGDSDNGLPAAASTLPE